MVIYCIYFCVIIPINNSLPYLVSIQLWTVDGFEFHLKKRAKFLFWPLEGCKILIESSYFCLFTALSRPTRELLPSKLNLSTSAESLAASDGSSRLVIRPK